MPRINPLLVPMSLTLGQRRAMLVIQRRLRERPDVGPSYQDLANDLGIHSKSGVWRLVQALVERGRLSMIPGKPRSLRVVVPVDDEAIGKTGLEGFSDREITGEAIARGLI